MSMSIKTIKQDIKLIKIIIKLDIIGDISEENLINYNSKLKPLLSLLTDGVDNFNKRVKASIAKLKEEIKSIPRELMNVISI